MTHAGRPTSRQAFATSLAGLGDRNGNSSAPAPNKHSSSGSAPSQQCSSSQEPFCVRNAVLLAFIPNYCKPPHGARKESTKTSPPSMSVLCPSCT